MSDATPIPDETARKPVPWWLWAHVLSLEAPLVAVLWQSALAHAHGLTLPPMLGAGLALACWLIYVLDRTLDTLSTDVVLDTRHFFYHRHRRLILLGVVPPAIAALTWMALFVIPEGVLWQALGLSLLVALYLASWSAQGSRVWRDLLFSCAGLGAIMVIADMPLEPGYRFALSVMVLVVMALSFLRHFEFRLHVIPKETAAALLFALGCTTATRFLSMPERWVEPVLECTLLALIFACNLHGISLREKGAAGARHVSLVLGTLSFTIAMLWMIHSGAIEGALRGPAQAALGVTVLHALLHRCRDRLSLDAYHVLADLVLVLPLPLVWW